MFKAFVLLVSFFISRIRMVCYKQCYVFCERSVCSGYCFGADAFFAVVMCPGFLVCFVVALGA